MALRNGLALGVFAPLMAAGQLATAQPRDLPPIIDLDPKYSVDPTSPDASLEVVCAKEALLGIEIPGASKSFGASDTRFGGTVERTSIVPADNASVTLDSGTPTEIKFDDRQFHHISAHMRNRPGDIPGENVIHIVATHDGAYSQNVTDATTVHINLAISGPKVVERAANAFRDDSKPVILNAGHGQWAAQTAQTLEYKFTQCMNIPLSDVESAGRPDNAATTVGQPPFTPGVPVSTLRPQPDEPLF